MDSASVAEWIVARFTTDERAASVIGDLLESASQKGRLWFWLSVARIVLRLAWRRPVAFVAALYLGMRFYGVLVRYGSNYIHATHRVPQSWQSPYGLLTAVTALLWFMAPYLVIRFGARDRFTQLAALFAITTAALYLAWWIPLVPFAFVGIMTTVAVVVAISLRWVWELLALSAAMLAAMASALLMFYVEAAWQRHAYPEPVSRINSLIPSFLILLFVWSTGFICSRAHDLFVWCDRREAAPRTSD